MPSRRLLEEFGRWVERSPDSPAVIGSGGTCSYGELDRLAHRARETVRGVPSGPVCVPASKSVETLALLLGCWAEDRGVLLPSEDLGGTVLGSLAARAGCSVLLTPAVTPDERFTVAVRRLPGEREEAPATPGTDALLLLTTSGSTGLPKTVPLSDTGVLEFHRWASDRFSLGPGRRVLSYAPLNFDLSLLDVWSALASGATTVLVDPRRATEGRYLRDLIVEHEVGLVQSVPMLFGMLTDHVGESGLPAVTDVLITGDTVRKSLVAEIGAMAPNARLFNVYGCTETNDSLVHEFDTSELGDSGRVPLGFPAAGVSTRIVDSASRVVRGEGTGELYVSTPFQAEGYLDPEATAEKFVPDPAGQTEDIYFRTGDIVTRSEEGTIFLEGRDDYHVKVRGVRTNLAEIEHVINEHPQIREAAVVAVPDEWAGKRICAYVSPLEGAARAELTTLGIRKYCGQRLARTSIPGKVRIVQRPLPRTSTGKIDRKAIQQEEERGFSDVAG
ncbi:AMP-binding protein [Actinopolyspora mortivallis]|uniref:AMP-binding protein n=1 Tax=Actinopolyspora mortivallis TaxID=33906 RepID=UPI0003779D3B|nr:AMP-binding protein [Actinopolyspora mortivallis]